MLQCWQADQQIPPAKNKLRTSFSSLKINKTHTLYVLPPCISLVTNHFPLPSPSQSLLTPIFTKSLLFPCSQFTGLFSILPYLLSYFCEPINKIPLILFLFTLHSLLYLASSLTRNTSPLLSIPVFLLGWPVFSLITIYFGGSL